ncbi:DUF4176 domain-containing protein [Lactococcus allomyrinae]|uniref:DUF4176 domain-containing protein n=1 Tax=Lactococcus allomyrinae TaxID=2419773 RepID=A0A387BPL2_9LACT|nr:DUF4176 domain-containing protein [Lactococcus allomyrinae]AYG00461.1 DUF4176 domain-containing protein [Lactococcus allomyrinae]
MNNNENEVKFLPLGSIVTVDNARETLMIISRFAETEMDGERGYFDYAAVRSSLGLIKADEIYFFNRENVEEAKFVGYIDAREQLFQDNAEDFSKNITLPHLKLENSQESDTFGF